MKNSKFLPMPPSIAFIGGAAASGHHSGTPSAPVDARQAARLLAQGATAITEADLDGWLAAEMRPLQTHRLQHQQHWQSAEHSYALAIAQIEQYSLIDSPLAS